MKTLIVQSDYLKSKFDICGILPIICLWYLHSCLVVCILRSLKRPKLRHVLIKTIWSLSVVTIKHMMCFVSCLLFSIQGTQNSDSKCTKLRLVVYTKTFMIQLFLYLFLFVVSCSTFFGTFKHFNWKMF